jgi:hypothetical protein
MCDSPNSVDRCAGRFVGSRTRYQPGTRFAHRQAMVGVILHGHVVNLCGGRPAAVPNRLPIQVGAVGQRVRVNQPLREHPLVDQIRLWRITRWCGNFFARPPVLHLVRVRLDRRLPCGRLQRGRPASIPRFTPLGGTASPRGGAAGIVAGLGFNRPALPLAAARLGAPPPQAGAAGIVAGLGGASPRTEERRRIRHRSGRRGFRSRLDCIFPPRWLTPMVPLGFIGRDTRDAAGPGPASRQQADR